jgi:adenylate kinase family enzyme
LWLIFQIAVDILLGSCNPPGDLDMADLPNVPKPHDVGTLRLLPDQKVILIVGPAGAGKTTMGQRIAMVKGWIHISEDSFWAELPRQPHRGRTDAEKAIVQPRTLESVIAELKRGKSVVLDFIIYETPPQPLFYYQAELTRLGVPVHTKVLRPAVENILSRQSLRGNAHDRELEFAQRLANAEHQVRCLSSEYIDPVWVVDSSRSSVEDVYRNHFAYLVGGAGD